MNYKVLYRKYRPDDFDNLVGQDSVKTILQNSIKNNKIAHAYIFAGPRGTGKTSTAKIFAKTINCLDNKDGIACGKCDNCENFATSTDIIEIDAASNNGVDQIREITNNVKLAPTMFKYKVYIIDEVHMLSQSAFNALLLTLEEPPQHVIFILATTNIENVPVTILSRCQRFDFKKINIEDIVARLQFVVKEEKIKADTDALSEIAYISDGGMRDALSILDQLSKEEDKITLDTVINKVGSVSIKSIEKLLDYVEKNDAKNIINQINEYRRSSLDYKLITKKIIDIAVKKAKDIVESGKSTRLSFKDYKQLVLNLTDCLNKINVNVDAYSLIELTLLEYVNLPVESEKAETPVIIEEIKKDKEDKVSKPDFIDIRINNCFVDAKKEYKINAIEKWSQFIKEIDNKKIKGIIIDSKVEMASESIYVISVPNHVVDEFNDNNIKITSCYKKIFKEEIKVVGVTLEKWKSVSQKYVDDKKSGIKYTYKEEPTNETKSQIEKMATNLFDSDKIEVQ